MLHLLTWRSTDGKATIHEGHNQELHFQDWRKWNSHLVWLSRKICSGLHLLWPGVSHNPNRCPVLHRRLSARTPPKKPNGATGLQLRGGIRCVSAASVNLNPFTDIRLYVRRELIGPTLWGFSSVQFAEYNTKRRLFSLRPEGLELCIRTSGGDYYVKLFEYFKCGNFRQEKRDKNCNAF